MRNPYYNYTTVREPQTFYGREEETHRLYEASEKKQSTSVVGLRSIGKSSMLQYITLDEVKSQFGYHLQNHLFIIVDLHDYLRKTLDEFFDLVCQQIFLKAQSIPDIKLSAQKGEDRFRALLEDLHEAGFHVVLLFDAFDKIVANVAFDPNFFAFMRGQATQGHVSYVTASIRPLHEVCHSDIVSSPFFNIFQNMQLGPLTRDAACKLITEPASQAGYPFTDNERDWILELAGRHPFLLQVTCRFFFEEKCKQNGDNIDLEALRARIYTGHIPIFDSIWDDLTEQQQNDLRSEARPSSPTQRKVPELSESWFLRKRVYGKFRKIEEKDVKEALENFEEISFLQNCKLSESHYVFVQDKGESGASSRGRLVQEFLKVAFERMRPVGTRSDSALEWRLYNILFYHYIKHHLPNDKTAGRLAISRRQFYREQEKAIQALTNELSELDNASLGVFR